jgi:hypothetical protein
LVAELVALATDVTATTDKYQFIEDEYEVDRKVRSDRQFESLLKGRFVSAVDQMDENTAAMKEIGSMHKTPAKKAVSLTRQSTEIGLEAS